MGTAGMVLINGFVRRTGKKYSAAVNLSISDCICMERLKVKQSLHSPSGQDGLQTKFTHQFFITRQSFQFCIRKKPRDLWMDLNRTNGFILR